MSRQKKIILIAGASLLAAALVVANLTFKRQQGVTVDTELIQARNLEAVVSASGKIRPKRSVNISANVVGRVTQLSVKEGDRVKTGQFLLEIDPKSLQSQVQRSEAALQAARSGIEQARTTVETARAGLELARENLKRQRELWSQQLTTREALDRAENEVKVRETELQAREVEVRTQEQRRRQTMAELENARHELSKVTILAPMEGMVTRRNIEEGETVVFGTMNNPGTVLMTIADMSVIEAELEVDETDIVSVALGQAAKVTIDALPDRTFAGVVTELGNSAIQAAGAQSGAARQATNFKVVVTLEGQIPAVRPDFTCTADITTARRAKVVGVPIQALTVRELILDAAGAIVRAPKTERRRPRTVETSVAASELKPGQSRKEVEGVFVVRDGRAEFAPIKTGIAGDKYFEVLDGLKAGERVITGPFNSVRGIADGDPVRVNAPRQK